MAAPACACAASSSPNSRRATCSSDSGERRPAREHHAPEIVRLAEELDRARAAGADREHPLYRQYPEAWLESQARAEIETLDATLRREPIYGQVPAFAGGERGVLDLLAVDHTGRLAVVELKATRRPAPAPAGAGLLDAREVAPRSRRVLARTDIFPESNCAPIRRACCWSRHRSNFIRPLRPY